jgi:hypothetical protein
MSNLAVHNPITMWETISGNTELTQNPPQQSGQTFKVGSPLELAVALPPVPGNPQVAQVWDGTLGSLIYGVALEGGGNLATAGEGYPANFGQQGPPWSAFSIGSPQNQPDAVIIPYGAPSLTGGVLTMLAVQDTIFQAQVDTSEPETAITAAAIALGVITATAANVHYVGEVIVFSGFAGLGAPLNGQTATVLTLIGGPPSTGYTAQLTSSYKGGHIAVAGVGADDPGPVSPGQWNVGQQYGLNVDANGYWYIDVNLRTPATNTMVSIFGMYQGDVLQSNAFLEVPNGQLLFQFLPVQTVQGS